MPATRRGAGLCRGRVSAGAARELFEQFSFCLPANEQMLGYPVAGPDNDLRPGIGATISSGTGRRARRASCRACSPTIPAARMCSRSRRR